jgi:hypothetical protein
MTIEETKKAIAVMQAYVDGAEIEYGFPPCFECGVTKDPSWNWADKTYKSKPKPREIWVNCYADGSTSNGHFSKEAAERYGVGMATGGSPRIVKFREVVE